MKKFFIFLILLINSISTCFDVVNEDPINTIKIQVITKFVSNPDNIRTFNINPGQTRTINLGPNSNRLQVKIFSPLNLINSQRILLYNIFGELLQDFKTSSTARILMKLNGIQINSRIIR